MEFWVRQVRAYSAVDPPHSILLSIFTFSGTGPVTATCEYSCARNERVAHACQDSNIQQWVAAVEVAVILETNRSFHVARVPDSLIYMTVLGRGPADSPAVVMAITQQAASVEFTKIAQGMSAWPSELRQHLFYFRRLIDPEFPLDVRWLNGYRLLEWHFVQNRAGLQACVEWRALLTRFDGFLAPMRRANQTSWGLIEEARALAAHAGGRRQLLLPPHCLA